MSPGEVASVDLPISVLVLTRNEEVNIAECLRSVAWASDVHVLDSFSDDQTVNIAQSAGARIHQRVFDNFSDHKNWALGHVPFRHAWVLLLDADERITPDLLKEIRELFRAGKPSSEGYYIPRINYFCGKRIRFGGWYPDWQLRLLEKSAGRYEKRIVHEHVLLRTEPGFLKNGLVHSDGKGIENYIARLNTYSSMEAVEIFLEAKNSPEGQLRAEWLGPGPGRRRALKKLAYRFLPARPLFKFLWIYFLRLGFLDGAIGLRFALLHAVYDYQISLKREELEDPVSPISRKYASVIARRTAP